MEEILQMSALELSKQIRHGSVSVKEAVEACKKQIQKSESQVHAYVSMDEKILAHRIKEVEEGIKSGRYTGPLAGVPIAVKYLYQRTENHLFFKNAGKLCPDL